MKIIKAKLKKLLDKELSVIEISKIFNCSRTAIYKAIKKNGYKIKYKGKTSKVLCKKCTNKIEAIWVQIMVQIMVQIVVVLDLGFVA